MLESKNYYIDLINSSKAYQFTCYYHYSGVGFKKAQLNQGIFRRDNNKLVGVLQWGHSAQEGVRLDRYVCDPITTDQYFELNRFCMDDDEGHNSESEAISLGIKWIKMNRPDIKLLVSYAGRKEGNYGYIYQATNWEYLGYFISDGFWALDGQERHKITVWHQYRRAADQSKGLIPTICGMYSNVVQTWTKQFIYIKRLDKRLHAASPVLSYPKATTDYPICTRVKCYQGSETFQAPPRERGEKPDWYYEKDELLFTRRTLMRNGELVPDYVAIYTKEGDLDAVVKTQREAAEYCGITPTSICNAIKSEKLCRNFFFRLTPANVEPSEQIDNGYFCEIDGLRFVKQVDVAEYLGISRQAVSFAKLHGGKTLGGKEVTWRN